jgi:DNA-directed RNA polymerase specialized sigma24 family protein
MPKNNPKPRVTWPTTHWSVVGRAGAAGEQDRRQAVATIVRSYLPALRRHVLARWNVAHEEADDITHNFVLSKLLGDRIVRFAPRRQAKFRTVLRKTLDNFVKNHFRAKSRESQGHKVESVGHNTSIFRHDAATADSFDSAWARQVIGQSIRRMKTRCAQTKRYDTWQVFRGRVLTHTLLGREPVAYTALVDALKLSSPSQAHNILVSGCRMYERMIREVISLYAGNETDVDNELRDLWQAVAQPPPKKARPLKEQ